MNHFVFTGPIEGTVTLDDGTVVDVTPGMVQVVDHAIAAQVAHKVSLRYEDEGHPKVTGKFKYDRPEGL